MKKLISKEKSEKIVLGKKGYGFKAAYIGVDSFVPYLMKDNLPTALAKFGEDNKLAGALHFKYYDFLKNLLVFERL